MEIIRCNCGYYKQLNDELCPKCGADYSLGAEYEILEDQESAYMRWMNLGEKGFNDYMESANKPHFMLCPKCKFKMLITETRCPRCNTPVKFVLSKDKALFSFPERFAFFATKAFLWAIIIGFIVFVLLLLIGFVLSI